MSALHPTHPEETEGETHLSFFYAFNKPIQTYKD